MHGGPRRSDLHILVALFNAKSFQRITDADVTASMEGLGHVGRVTKKLERMDIADAITFGAYFPFQGPDKYTIQVEIKLPGRAKTTTVSFSYDA